MIDLKYLKARVYIYRQYNFPWADDHVPLLAAVTELAELVRAHIENECKITGEDVAHRRKCDAIGDAVICLLDYAGRQGIDVEQAIRDAWEEIKDRDYIRWPESKGQRPGTPKDR